MVEFAPFRISLERRLQTLAVSHFIYCFLAFGKFKSFKYTVETMA